MPGSSTGKEMTRSSRAFYLSLIIGLAAVKTCEATSLQVSPVTIDIPPSGASAVVTLRNSGNKPLSAQIRVFKWTQADGEDVLEPTESVVASPPSIDLTGDQTYSVRIVRTDETPVTRSEYYRLIVDELPDSATPRPGTVSMVMRYSIPVFFEQADGEPPKLSWSFKKSNGSVALTLRNDGDQHIKISNLTLKSGAGATVGFGAGLVGYALAHSQVVWTRNSKGFSGGPSKVTAQTDMGPINGEAVEQR
jgi:fimbrial chaperone protein